ncbi:polysaccharide deacetylase family protein [Streptomyces sp. NPDC048106]|uniref:polysaccharide deacetylase family protein n=1 Tax=Streptomyces sp. NPDC048106 TaxID=3155750 RepID=UPI0034546070
MRLVVQNDKNRAFGSGVTPGRRKRGVALGCGAAVLAATALVTGCSGSGPDAVRPAAGQGAAGHAAPDPRAAEHTRMVAAARRWGLDEVPIAPPPPPAVKPTITARAGFEVDHQDDWDLPPVFTTVPTRNKVVFLTIDDGSEKDPRFLRMMRDLKIPYTAFLSNYLVKDDYGYFRTAQSYGNTVDNHTLTHPYLPGLSYEEQKHEICDMQDIMLKQYGRRPTVFRPPYGNYNQDTLVAAKSCGIKYAPIWNEEVYVDHWEYREDDQRLRRGDIVLTHFRGRSDWDGTMVDDMRRFLNKVTREGYAVARLEDYL